MAESKRILLILLGVQEMVAGNSLETREVGRDAKQSFLVVGSWLIDYNCVK